jgi:hypothetical protein
VDPRSAQAEAQLAVFGKQVTGVESALLAESALLQPLAYGAAAGGPLADLFARRFAGMDGGAAGPSKRRKKKDAAAALEEEEERQAEEQAALDDGGAGAQPANDPDGMHFGMLLPDLHLDLSSPLHACGAVPAHLQTRQH